MTYYAEDSFPAEIAAQVNPLHNDVLKFKVRLCSLISDKKAVPKPHDDTLYMYTFISNVSGGRSLKVVDITVPEDKVYHPKDTFYWDFYDRVSHHPMKVLVAFDAANEYTLTFKLLTDHQAFIPELNQYISVWPYMMGVSINLADSLYSEWFSTYTFELNEVIPWDSTIQLYFTDYDYHNRSISYVLEPRADRITGYKEGLFVDSSVFQAEQFTVLYFGGHWCGHCMDEIPKLHKLSELRRKHKFDLLTTLTYQEGTKEEAQAYYIKNLFPIESRLELLNSPIIHGFRVHSYPSYIVIDGDGKVLFRSDMNDGDPHAQIWSLIKGL